MDAVDTSSWPHFPKGARLSAEKLRVPIVVGNQPVVPLRSPNSCRGCVANTIAYGDITCTQLPGCDSLIWAPATPETLATYVLEKLEGPHDT